MQLARIVRDHQFLQGCEGKTIRLLSFFNFLRFQDTYLKKSN